MSDVSFTGGQCQGIYRVSATIKYSMPGIGLADGSATRDYVGPISGFRVDRNKPGAGQTAPAGPYSYVYITANGVETKFSENPGYAGSIGFCDQVIILDVVITPLGFTDNCGNYDQYTCINGQCVIDPTGANRQTLSQCKFTSYPQDYEKGACFTNYRLVFEARNKSTGALVRRNAQFGSLGYVAGPLLYIREPDPINTVWRFDYLNIAARRASTGFNVSTFNQPVLVEVVRIDGLPDECATTNSCSLYPRPSESSYELQSEVTRIRALADAVAAQQKSISDAAILRNR